MKELKSFSKKANLKCIYCGEDQDAPAIDFIPYRPQLLGTKNPEHSDSVTSEKCCGCDEVFYTRLHNNRVFVANLASKLYDLGS